MQRLKTLVMITTLLSDALIHQRNLGNGDLGSEFNQGLNGIEDIRTETNEAYPLYRESNLEAARRS